MTTDPTQSLSASVRENIEAITEGADRGEMKSQIQARIRAINKAKGRLNRKRDDGVGIRDIDLGEALRFLRGEDITLPPQIKFTNLQKSPDPQRAPLSKGPILRNFSYNVGIVNPATGEIIGGVTVSSNERRSHADIIAQASASIGSAGVEQYSDEDDIPDDFGLILLSSLEASETII